VFHVGHVIRQLRTDQGWTIDDLAARAHVGKMTVSGIERGERNYRRHTLDALARALGMTPEGLVARLTQREPAAPPPEPPVSDEDRLFLQQYRALGDAAQRAVRAYVADQSELEAARRRGGRRPAPKAAAPIAETVRETSARSRRR
jgi:transcriptional regulator with XRE-family HTH domain